MIATPAVRALIREGKAHQMYSQIQTGARFGMTTMASSLSRLVRSGVVRLSDAEQALSDPSELHTLVRAA
jgi:twitching motility protein PilT